MTWLIGCILLGLAGVFTLAAAMTGKEVLLFHGAMTALVGFAVMLAVALKGGGDEP